MKRSERFSKYARQHFLMAAALLAVSVAAGCWVPSAFLSDQAASGGALLVVAAGTLFTAVLFAREAWIFRRLSRSEATAEESWKRETEIRPSL